MNRRDAQRFAASLPDPFLQCRRWSHDWKPHTVVKIGRAFESVIMCKRCGTRYVELMGSTGDVVKKHYIYPDGYLTKGLGRLDAGARGALRVEVVQRWLKAS